MVLLLVSTCGAAVMPVDYKEVIAQELERQHPELDRFILDYSPPVTAFVTWEAAGLPRTPMFVVAFSYKFLDAPGGLAVFDKRKLLAFAGPKTCQVEWIFTDPRFRFKTSSRLLSRGDGAEQGRLTIEPKR